MSRSAIRIQTIQGSEVATLITGATGGLGREVARRLAQAGVSHLILPVRDERSGDALRSEIAAAGCENVSTPLLELSSLSNVGQFVDNFRSREHAVRLQGLLFNAGTQSASKLRFTGEGIESTFAVNHLAHYALFRTLRDQLTPTAIVGWTTSGTHDPSERMARLFGFRGAQYHTAAMLALGNYPGAMNPAQSCRDAYATSKLCNILMARHFGASEPGQRRFFAFDPGLMPGTGLARDQHGIALAAWNHVMPHLIGILPGASTPKRSGDMLHRLMQGQIAVERNGSYFNYSGKVVAPYIPNHEQSVIRDLISTSEEWLTRTLN
jgi:NAD(P)-dependent dehydrogenase (short-subunit alcohol dehydrogenase family)